MTTTRPDLLTLFNDSLDRWLALLRELVALESPTDDKAAVDRLGARIAAEARKAGAKVTVHPRAEVGDIVEAGWHTDAPGRPLVIVCHMDTVHPLGAIVSNPIREDQGRLYGPGVFDMKGGIVAALAAVSALEDMGHLPERPLTLLVTSDEETGSRHSRDLIRARAAEAALAMILEPALADGSLKTWRKTVADFVVRAYGIAAHAGSAHETGLNAIEEIAHQVIRLQRMTDYTAGTTVSVGVVQGGTRPNVIPDMCELQVDARAMTQAEVDRLTAEVYALQPVLPGARLEISGGFDRPPMERNATMIETFERARGIAAHYGLTLRESGTGGASDGNYTAAIGTPTLDGLGPAGNGAHSEREHIIVGSLAVSAAQVAALLLEWPG
jgi:glutamate carboxypeptidase